MNQSFNTFTSALLCAIALVVTSCKTNDLNGRDGISYPDPLGQKADFASNENPEPGESVSTDGTPEAATTVVSVENASDKALATGQIKVTKTLLQAAPVGGEVRYRIDLQALQDLKSVRVTEIIPDGIKFNSAEPMANLSDDEASWIFSYIGKDVTRSIEISVIPITEGDYQMDSNVSVENCFSLDLFAGQPKLTIEKEGPQSVELGNTAEWRVTITNNGSADAKNVVITDKLPSAFEPTTKLRHSIGILPAGETETVIYSAKAVTQGEFENHAIATYEGGILDSVESKLPIKVVRSGLRVRKTGPAEAYVFKPEVFKITIENTGDTDLKNIRITDILPEGSSIADNGLGRVSGNAIGWMIPVLPVGSSQLITTEIASTRKGESTNTVQVIAPNGVKASDSATTNWLAVPGVTVSISDNKDPIRVKERTTYNIQVNNQGKFEPVSGTVTVTFNESVKPITITGDAQGKIEGQTVTFPRTTLEPGKDIFLSVIAEGAKIGAGRIVMNFNADFLSEPILSQETTNVY